MRPLIKQSGRLYRRLCLCTIKMQLINIQTLNSICTIKNSNASEMLLINIKKDLKENDAFLLAESVNKTLIKNFLNLNKPLLLCNPPKSSIELLNGKYPSQMNHVTLADFDLSDISRIFWSTKFNINQDRSLEILNYLRSFSPPSINLKFVAVTDSYKFLYNIGLMYIYQELIYGDYLNPTFYLYMPPIVYSPQNKFLPISWPLKLGVFLRNFFDITYLGSQSTKSFSLTRQYHSFVKKLAKEQELHLIRLIPKDINMLKQLTHGNLITFQFFINYLIRHPKYASLITILEEFIPECGEELIQEGFRMTDFPSTLSVDQWVKAFQVFITIPEFSNCSFLEEFKSYHTYHEDKGFFLDYPDELLKDDLSEFVKYEDSVSDHPE